MINQNNLKRNSKEFSFVDTLGSFINNYHWAEGYRDFQLGNDTSKAYLWNVLSAIGNDYGETIYENVVNYIDNASNVDLCKIKALKSMATILGVKYQVFENITGIPTEVLGLLDILSVNKKYLLNNKTFISAFYPELSSFGCILQGSNSTISSEVEDYDRKIENNQLSLDLNYLDESQYELFLKNVYKQCLQKFVYLKYADLENNLSVNTNDRTYIYEYIYEDLIGIQSTTDSLSKGSYDKTIASLKLKYKIGNEFDPTQIMDDIEDQVDFFDNYSSNQQEILSVELKKRQDTYQYSKIYSKDDETLGNSLTRYSYYRERKVKEYFNFIESIYNNLITKTDIEASIRDNTGRIITQYDKDPNYFKIDQSTEQTLITYDRDTSSVVVQINMITKISELLQQWTTQLTEIREQLKIQLQKQYMKGTFLLLSYIINEYLKYNISDKYGKDIYTLDGSTTLKAILDKTLTEGNNVELVEYTDTTEYYNIKNDKTDISSLNSGVVNPKFWDDGYRKIGIDTYDIPLEEISSYYIQQLQLDKYNVDDTVEFLSILFEYGANSSFIKKDKTEEKETIQVTAQTSSYMCVGQNGEYIGDIDQKEYELNNKISADQYYLDTINGYISQGCQIESQPLSDQLSTISSWCFSNYVSQISSQNQDSYDSMIDNLQTNREEIMNVSSNVDQVSSDYNDLKTNKKYWIYLSDYVEVNDYLSVKMENFKLSCTDRFTFSNHWLLDELTANTEDLSGLSVKYEALAKDLSDVVELSIKSTDGLGYYSFLVDTTQEIDQQCTQIASYLQEQVSQIEQSINEHQQNHLEKLIQYKEDVNNMIDAYLKAESMLTTLSASILKATGSGVDSYSGSVDVWEEQRGSHYWNRYVYAEQVIYPPKIESWTWEPQPISYDAIDTTHGLTATLQSLNERCNANVPLGLSLRGDDNTLTSRLVLINGTAVWLDIVSDKSCYSSISQIWKKYYSEADANYITSTLNSLVTNFADVQRMINNELDCIGSAIGSISITDVTVDNIGSKLEDLFTQVLEKIRQYDDEYVKLQRQCETDAFVCIVAGKIEKIRSVIERLNDFQKRIAELKQNFEDLRTQYSDYLADYIYTSDGKLDEQIRKLVAWIKQNDITNKNTVLSTINNLLLQLSDLYDALKGIADFVVFYRVDSVDEQQTYVVSESTTAYSSLYNNVEQIIDHVINDIDDNINTTLFNSAIEAIRTFVTNNLIQHDIDILNSIANDLKEYLNDFTLVTILLQNLIDKLHDEVDYIESQRQWYNENKKMFLMYSGLDNGNDPYYNYKNLTHPSYQIHPYLYKFVEKTNTVYPIANTFFLAFSDTYEQDLINLSIDNLIGPYGNIIDLWKNDMYDWSGYRTQYEARVNEDDISLQYSKQIEFTGLFYPPALQEFLDNPDYFVQRVRSNAKDSYYYHLNLTTEQREKIAEQLEEYEKPIRLVAQAQLTPELAANDGRLSGEYDIYKYGQDAYGNSLILLKSYKHLYKENADNPDYRPSYNERKNALGELWMRIKNHPIAFPAFDLRTTYEDVSQYNIKEEVGKKGKHINDYIKYINESYKGEEYMTDSIGSTLQPQALKCFFDMEFEPSNRAILLNVPYRTGYLNKSSSTRKILGTSNKTYANSSVIVGVLKQDFDYQLNMNVYSFTGDSFGNTNIDDIANPGIILVDDTGHNYSTASTRHYDFIGFSRGSSYIYCLFMERSFTYGSEKSTFTVGKNGYPRIKIKPFGYKYSTSLYKPSTDVVITDVKYNIFDKTLVDADLRYLYKNADSIVSTCDGNNLTIAYVATRVQPVTPKNKSKIKTTDDPYNQNNTTVITYPEYTNVVEQNSVSSYGENESYPRSTAILQTDDDQHIVIYNSFDSFTSYLVLIQMKIVGHAIRYSQTKYFNLDTDIGFMPLFADTCGNTRFSYNQALSGEEQYNIELLGPEKAEVNATPVIVDTTDEKYGRVTEDYQEYNKFISYNEGDLSILPNEAYVSYTFELSDVLSAEYDGQSVYDNIKETSQLTKYKYLLMNSKYITVPIIKGSFKLSDPVCCLYQGAETYDLLSGEEIIGPNGVSFQNIGQSNHINNISSIQTTVNYDPNTLLPTSISLSCFVREKKSTTQKIDNQLIELMVYNKNSVKSYDFYHIFENPNSNMTAILSDDLGSLSGQPALLNSLLEDIDFSEISSLSDYYIPGTTIYPFKNYAIGKKTNEMSALLEFKYSEENTINREFPYLDSEDIEDDINIVTNDSQYIYYFSLDDFDTIDNKPFQMEKYNVSTGTYVTTDINDTSEKYREFFEKALTLWVTYNIEVVDESKVDDTESPPTPLVGYYGIVLYFNYKNYTDTPYVEYSRGTGDGDPPTWRYSQASDESIAQTYLVLKPGQSGKIQIRIDHLEFDKLDQKSLAQSVVGKKTDIIKTYYILNTSQDKPKFKISREPFS